MAQNVNFKRVEVSGVTKEEALANAPFNVNLPGADCTQALRNAKKKHVGAWTDADMKHFMLEQLEKKTRNTPGNGCYIVIESAVADSREKPYKITDVKNEGARETAKVFQLIDKATNQVIAETPVTQVTHTDKEGNVIVDKEGNPKLYWKSYTKAEAKEVAKNLIMKSGFKGKGYCRLTHQVVKGEDKVFEFEYVPSKNSRPGVYLCFGIESF